MTPTDDVPDACEHCGAADVPLMRYGRDLVCGPCSFIADTDAARTALDDLCSHLTTHTGDH